MSAETQQGGTRQGETHQPAEQPQRSAVEAVKRGSRSLRGSVAEELGPEHRRFSEENAQVLKFHGIYQQDNRDLRKGVPKDERDFRLMVRGRIPGGRLTAAQWRTYDEIAGRYGNGTLRLTTRQSLQLHLVPRGELRATIRAINAMLLSTAGACGDLVRNVMLTPDPSPGPLQAELAREAERLSARFRPQSTAYAEIWLGDERVSTVNGAEEPIYGDAYLPRKFKMAVTLAGDNSVDAYTQDLAFVAVPEGDGLAGYNVLAGGGMGKTHRKPETFPRLADEIGFIPPEALPDVAEAAVTIHRDFGDRANRKHARLKYLLHDHGVAWFRGELEARAGVALQPWRPVPLPVREWLGWHPLEGAGWALGVRVASGRVQDTEGAQTRSFLRGLARHEHLTFRITPQQNLLVLGIGRDERAGIEALAQQHGVALEPPPSVHRHALACPALPTCGLAVSEAERAIDGFLAELEGALQAAHPAGTPPVVRMTGCPNGCARPYTAEIGLVGHGPGIYALYLGGDRDGARLAREFRSSIKLQQVPGLLGGLFAAWRSEAPEADFGDFVDARWEALQDVARQSA